MDRTNGTHQFLKQTLVQKVCRRGDSLPILARLITSLFALFVTASATSAVVEINGNQIQTNGALNATVDYTADKLSINIPGVTIILDCGAEVPANSCTLTTGPSGIDQTALTPTFGSPSPLDGGFTVQVTNYDGVYSWSATSSPGTANINGAGLVTVSGLSSGQSATVTVTATRSGYATGSAVVSGAANTADPALEAALVPYLAVPTSTTDGFTVQISNYDGAYSWSVESTAGSAVISGSGLVTVSGLSAGQSATIRVSTSRSGYADGAAEKTGSAETAEATCSPGMDCWDSLADLCSKPRPESNFNGEQTTYDTQCEDYDPTQNPPVGDGGGDKTEEECPGPGYDCYVPPVADSGSEGEGAEEVVADPFPIGSDRVVNHAGDENGKFDFGSEGRNGGSGRVYWVVEKGVVSYAGLTLTEDEGSEAIRLSFGVTADQPSAALHYWISKEPDGDSIQDCGYVGYAQTSQRVAIDGSEDCQLERGGKYFINLALCDSEEGDIECRSAQATAAERDAVLAVRSSLIDR